MKPEMTATPSPKKISVVAAATDEFLARGFDGTSMDRIAEAANVSKRTIYSHFQGKEELFQAIGLIVLERVREMPGHSYSPDVPLSDQLLEIGNTFIATICNSEFMKLSRVMLARFAQSPDASHATCKVYARLRQNIVAFMRAGRKDGRLRLRSPEDAAAQFCGLIKEVAYWPEMIAGQQAASPESQNSAVASAVQMFLRHHEVQLR